MKIEMFLQSFVRLTGVFLSARSFSPLAVERVKKREKNYKTREEKGLHSQILELQKFLRARGIFKKRSVNYVPIYLMNVCWSVPRLLLTNIPPR